MRRCASCIFATDGSEPVRVVLGDFDLTHAEVEDAMNSVSQGQLEVAVTWARIREAALVGLLAKSW